jgi:hypothetical protein
VDTQEPGDSGGEEAARYSGLVALRLSHSSPSSRKSFHVCALDIAVSFLLLAMDVFETVAKKKTARDVANEWRRDDASLQSNPSQIISDNAHSEAAGDLQDTVQAIIAGHYGLQWIIARGNRSGSLAAGAALESAVRRVAAVEGRLEELLSLQGHQALPVLEALQTVYSSSRAPDTRSSAIVSRFHS